MRLPRMTTRDWMIAVAGSSIVFACLGVSFAAAMVLVAFLISALIARPANGKEWLVLLLGAFAALPSILLAWLYTFAFRAALYVGHWPYYNNPDPKDLPERFHPYSEFLKYLVPVVISVASTCLFAFAVPRLARPCRQFYCAVAGALAIGALPILLFFLDPAGVWEWIID
jgi:hypothetical protein